MPNETMERIVEKYPWIKGENQKLIISPDSDGFLSSLLLINYFNARVVGYYDCKVMLCEEEVEPRECTFVDLDIFCQDFKSIGHHMVCFNKNKKPDNWHHYDNCIQVNNLRDFDCKHNFQQKYPFATIHFLLSLLETVKDIEIAPKAIVPLLFSDGVLNNLFGYPENCLEWFQWMKANIPESLLYHVFYKEIPFSSVMAQVKDFFEARDRYNSTCYYDFNERRIVERHKSRSGHHMIISQSNGTPTNIIPNADGTYDIFNNEKLRIMGFVDLMAGLMGWHTCPEKWGFSNMRLYRFKKEILSDSSTLRLNQKNYKEIVESNCFSMAITGTTTIEYTRDTEGFFRR